MFRCVTGFQAYYIKDIYSYLCFYDTLLMQVKEQTNGAKFEKEIRAEQEKKKQELHEAKLRKQAFKDKAAAFQ